MTNNLKDSINSIWGELLRYRKEVSITNVESYLYALSENDQISEVNHFDNKFEYYISSNVIDNDNYQSESFYQSALYLVYKVNSDSSVVEFLRKYWTLITYIKLVTNDDVFIISHMAQSLDGKVCTITGNSKWIGNQENLIHAHRLRAIVDGVLVGGNTAVSDLPQLTVRHVKGNNPVRLIFSDQFDNYNNLNNAEDQRTINIRSKPAAKSDQNVDLDFEYYNKNDPNYLNNILQSLKAKGIRSILVEGGPTMASSFLAHRLVHVVQLHIAPIILGSGKSNFQLSEIEGINQASQLVDPQYSIMGNAHMVTGIPKLHSSAEYAPKIKRRSSAPIPTAHGSFDTIAYSYSVQEQMPHLVLLNKETDFALPVNIRIHSECMTGDLFGSYRCECGEQLDKSMEYIAQNGGAIIYLRQEGRGIGIINKLHAYSKQDEGYNTADANKELGFGYDDRTYQDAVVILNDLGINQINLLTNNSDKIKAIDQSSIKLIETIPLEIQPRKENIDYLKTKKDFFGHTLINI